MKRTLALAVVALSFAALAGCGGDKKAEEAGGQKISLEFFIMSKCPYGVKLMNDVVPLIEKMGGNIDLQVNYIGRSKDGELTSMHGEDEVKGDIVQLCAREVGTFDGWFSFLKCQNGYDEKAPENPKQKPKWRDIPQGWEKCAETAKIDVAKLKSCYEGDQGKELLRKSFQRAEEKKAKSSPTIFLAGEPYKGGRTEASFGRAICAKFTENKPKYCADIPAPVKVPVTVVADKRCTARTCDTKRFVAFITNTFEGAEVKELDYADAEGKAAFDKTGEKFLPVAIFGADVEKEEAGYNRLKRRLKKLDATNEWLYPLGREWDPKAEICDDQQDNTGDGKIDCEDDTCKDKKICREEIKNSARLFVMSQCPYGVMTVDAMDEVLKNFGKDRKKIDFRIEFIGRDVGGTLSSMHGQAEVDEDLRQICAQKYYEKDYKFMEYVLCRNEVFKSSRGKAPTEVPDWTACAKNGIKADVIKKCAEGDEGKALLAASFKLASDLQISGSPGWLLNNKFDLRARNPEAIKNEFCAKNEGTAGCENKLSGDAAAPMPAGSCGGGGQPPMDIKKIAPPGAPGPGAPVPPGPAAVAPPGPPPAPPAAKKPE